MNATVPSPSERDWIAYYNAIAGRPPRATLLQALAFVDAELPADLPKFAVDLGCGDGRDTVELLQRQWHVLAIDGEEAAISRLLSRTDIHLDLLQTRIERFEVLTLPRSLDLINASYCLPFCPAMAFPGLWQTITQALRPGGRFSGQLFGDRDSWLGTLKTTHHTRQQVEALLAAFEVEVLEEEEHAGKTAIGEDKYWHLFHIVARKK